MDYRAGLTANVVSMGTGRTDTAQAEQAIFTSIRTPMGEGYRLVAMSPGITSEERAEITRRSPSHGSLGDSDPEAQALSSYGLNTGRQCVAWTRYAGREHTARGGQRVHTHLAVLEAAGFAAFGCDPFRVHAVLREAIGDVPNIKPTSSLPCLKLPLPACPPVTLGAEDGSASLPAAPDIIQNACCVAAQLLGREAVLVLGAADPLELLRWTVAVLPQGFRANLTVSANLQYASSRHIRLTCVGENSPELQRAVQGQSVHILDLGCAVQPADSPYSAWFEFILERFAEGRLAETIAVADQLDGTLDRQLPVRIAAVCRDADRVERASQATLEELAARYGDVHPVHPAEARMVRQLLSAAVRRSAYLQHPTGAGPMCRM